MKNNADNFASIFTNRPYFLLYTFTFITVKNKQQLHIYIHNGRTKAAAYTIHYSHHTETFFILTPLVFFYQIHKSNVN